MRQAFFVRLMFLFCIALFSLSTVARADDEPVRVVFHVDYADTSRYSLTLTSVNNLLDAYDAELKPVEVSMVFVGNAIRFTTDSPMTGTPFDTTNDAKFKADRELLKERLDSLIKSRHVKVYLCGNTLSESGVDKAKLYPGVEVTPSGVAKIAELEHAGAAYLKIQ
jgi:intracellular sulfur oxidation DsrE/DsrF family protein